MPTPASPATQNGRSSRVFNEADETRLLKSFLKITKSSPPPASVVDSDTVDRISKLLGPKFSPSQINDKIRRLRLKYHKHARSRSLIKTPHDQRTFKIAQRIWGKRKNTEPVAIADQQEEMGIEERRDEGADLEQFPYLVAEFSRILPDNEVWREGLRHLEEVKLREMNHKWISLKVEEAKLVAKRAELVQEQVKLVMETVQNPEELENGF